MSSHRKVNYIWGSSSPTFFLPFSVPPSLPSFLNPSLQMSCYSFIQQIFDFITHSQFRETTDSINQHNPKPHEVYRYGGFSSKGEPTNKSMISRIMWERRHTTEGGWHPRKDQNAFLRKLQKGWDQRQETGQEKEKWVGFQVQCPCRGDNMTNSRTQRCDGKEKGMEMRFLRRGPTDYSKESKLYHSNNRNHPRRPSKGPKKARDLLRAAVMGTG